MKRDISSLDWNTVDVAFLKANHTWVLPQVLAFFNQVIRLQRTGDSEKISSRATLRALHADLLDGRVRFASGKVVTPRELTVLLQYINYAPRGELITGTQTSTQNSRYAAGVPLLLSAFKEYRGVPYSAWDYSDPAIQQFLCKDLFELIPYMGVTHDFDLLEIREIGRTQKSGKNPGKQKNYVSCTAITGITDPDFKKLPRLLKLMLCQCWVFHPTVRHALAWTDLCNLDEPAPPLVDPVVVPAASDVFKLPWDTGDAVVLPQKPTKISEDPSLLPWQ